jgi:hypothetical protein
MPNERLRPTDRQAQIAKGRELILKMRREWQNELLPDAFILLRRIERDGPGYNTSETNSAETMLAKSDLITDHYSTDIGSAMLFVEVDGITEAGRAVLAALNEDEVKQQY